MLNFQTLTYFDDVSVTGKWWISGHARHKVSGTLTINPQKGCRLEVEGSLRMRKERIPSLFVPTNYLAISGKTDDGVPITLFKCFVTEQTSARTVYFVNRAIVGAHFRDFSEIKFNWFSLSLVGMEAWVGQDAISSEMKEDDGRDVWTLTYRQPPPISATVPSAQLTLEVGSDVHFESHRSPPNAGIHHRNVVVVRPERPLTWAQYQQRLGQVLDLVTLLSAETLPIRQIRAGVSGRRGAAATQSAANGPVVHIFANLRQSEDADDMQYRHPLFSVLDIRRDFESICRGWFGAAERLRRVRAVFFSTVRTKGSFLDQRLFAYAQTLEAFHRMTATTGKNIEYAKRLRRLFGSLEPDTARMITTDVERFCRATVDTRNLVTHLDEHQDATPFPRELWHVACRKLETLIFVLLLRECGIPEERIRSRMNRVARFSGHGYDFNAQFLMIIGNGADTETGACASARIALSATNSWRLVDLLRRGKAACRWVLLDCLGRRRRGHSQ